MSENLVNGLSFMGGFIVVSFFSGMTIATFLAKRKWEARVEAAGNNRHHYRYLYNVAACQLGAIRHMTQEMLRGQSQTNPYRDGPGKLLEALEAIRDKADEALKSVCRETGCFTSLEEAGEFLKSWDSFHDGHGKHGHSYPIVVKHEEWDGTCWHVVYGSDGETGDVDDVLDDIRRGHPVSMTQAADAINAIEMKKKHGRYPLSSDGS